MEEETQLALARAIFCGATKDKDGYCGCPRCGSRKLTHDGIALDDEYLERNECNFYITGTNPYKMIAHWNSLNRQSFQLQLPFPFVV